MQLQDLLFVKILMLNLLNYLQAQLECQQSKNFVTIKIVVPLFPSRFSVQEVSSQYQKKVKFEKKIEETARKIEEPMKFY